MKILFIGDFLDKEKQEAPLMVASRLFYSFLSKGHEAAYLSYFKGGSSDISKLFKQDTTSRKPLIGKTGIFPLISYVIKNKPDIIYLANIDFFYIVVFPLKYFLHFRMVYTVHGLIHYELKYFRKAGIISSLKSKLIERMIFRYCDKIFFLSAKLSRLSSIYCRIKAGKRVIIENGITPEEICKNYERPLDTMNLKIAVVAVLGKGERKEKGIDLLVNYLTSLPVIHVPEPPQGEQLPSPQSTTPTKDKTLSSPSLPVTLGQKKYEINIYGAGSEKRESSGIVDINYLKFINDEELSSVLINNDIIIVPSRYEPFNMALLKAMGLGMICLCSDRVGLSERFDSVLSRFVYRYNNSEDFNKKLNYIINMDIQQLKYYSAYMKTFALHFTWEKISEKYLSEFNDIR